MYMCNSEADIVRVFDEYLAFMGSSEVPVEVKKQALMASSKFANFAATQQSYQKLLRIAFGLSSILGSSQAYDALTKSLRAEFKTF